MLMIRKTALPSAAPSAHTRTGANQRQCVIVRFGVEGPTVGAKDIEQGVVERRVGQDPAERVHDEDTEEGARREGCAIPF